MDLEDSAEERLTRWSMERVKMPFKKPTAPSNVSESPDRLFLDSPKRRHPSLFDHQGQMLRNYVAQALKATRRRVGAAVEPTAVLADYLQTEADRIRTERPEASGMAAAHGGGCEPHFLPCTEPCTSATLFATFHGPAGVSATAASAKPLRA
jgi:hypothetical protein